MDDTGSIFNDNDSDNDNSGREEENGDDGNNGNDGREENAQLYERPNRSTARATDEQIKYVRILLRDGFLDRDDFYSSLEFFRKKTALTMERADKLIKVGKKRMADYKARQREAQERWG
jgi:hypothetical protein